MLISGYRQLICKISLRWAERSKAAFADNPNSLFGIVQGGTYADLRTESAQGLIEIGFDGYAIGGLSVGEAADERNATLDALLPVLPIDKPRYLMGVGGSRWHTASSSSTRSRA